MIFKILQYISCVKWRPVIQTPNATRCVREFLENCNSCLHDSQWLLMPWAQSCGEELMLAWPLEWSFTWGRGVEIPSFTNGVHKGGARN